MAESLRGAEKYSWIANEIRRRIAVGEMPPGSQLPQRAELEQSFQVSKVTLQRAMNLLIEDGFIDATRRKGSFVADRPPHLSRYALVFQAQRSGPGKWSRFWTALRNEATRREDEHGLSMPAFYGIDSHTDTDEYAKLAGEVFEHRLAGLIYVADYPKSSDLSWLLASGCPCVAVKGDADGNVPVVTVNEDSFVSQALDAVVQAGRRRVAFVTPGEFAERREEFLLEQAYRRGLEMHPYWVQGIGLDSPHSARNAVHLMLNGKQHERPDALVITDDNLVEAATTGLVLAGVSVPGDVEVIAHANFPDKTPSAVAAKRLGFDVRLIMESCLHLIELQRQGDQFTRRIQTPAVFENELGK